jgi:GT2 family glycosyltransferase
VNQVAVVIPSWNTSALTAKCLQSLSRSSLALEVLVVENASDDDSAMMIARDFPLVRLLRNERNLGFARACNQGIRNSKAPYVLLLNSDTEVAADAVERLWQFLEANPTYAAAAPRLLQADGSIQRACMNFPTWRSALWFATPLERWLPESAELRRYFARDFDYEHDGDVAQPPDRADNTHIAGIERRALKQRTPLSRGEEPGDINPIADSRRPIRGNTDPRGQI